MKIDELIENAEEKARVHEYHADIFENGNPMRDACLKSSKDCKQLAEWLIQLKEYQSLEEQGRLIKLPCKVGDTVYAICTCEAVDTVLDGTLYGSNGGFGTATGYYCPYELSDKCPHIDADDCDECKNIEAVFEDTVDYINITEYETIIGLHNTNLCVTIDEIGKTVFLTKSEAEAKLKELRGNDNGKQSIVTYKQIKRF